ncbi:LPS assembly protein LptD [Yoonia sp. BS5-3]|uniref:LPS-assembly protein LptD n=1 Tax=Yoonia phaeophyticola TaxID=3137369 RepID=A0ABZ2V477_9RHOB
MRLVALLLALLLPSSLFAQGAATLIADQVQLNDQEQLIASGSVEVLYEGSRLTASQIIYDRQQDALIITGPIVIRAADGTVLIADRAELDPQLENGILQGARIVLDQQLQLAANQIDRQDGRYSQLYKTVATSCQVCSDQAPLWEIRAERVVHDTEARQLYFTNATFRVRGVPLIWLPQMRLPDPTLDRATGFLIPEQRNTTQLGTGIKIPYFITLSDYADITLTPYLSSETTTLELLYRQNFVNGSIDVEAAASDDTLQDQDRSYIFLDGTFRLENDVQLSFDIEAVSDTAYLLDYGYSSKDRLDSAISLVKVTEDSLAQGRLTNYQTLRDDETNSSLPPIIGDASYETRLKPDFGGVLTLESSIDTAYRSSDDDGDDGRDVTRVGAQAAWEHSWVLQQGFVGTFETGLRGDFYEISDDSSYDELDLRVAPQVGGTLRWPLGRAGENGTAHLIEPTISLSWAESYGATPPNEDSTRSELDAGNLFDLSRFSGEDVIETGGQAAIGLSWTRNGALGMNSILSFGRVYRTDAQAEFTTSSGLEEQQSDWLIGGQITTVDGFLFDSRTLWDDNDGVNRADARLIWQNEDVTLSAAYIWQSADADEDRDDPISEWSFDGDFQLSEAWAVNMDARYDVADDRPVSGGLGLEWQNECVSIDVSVSRRYTSSDTVDPTTTYGLSGSITGFSTGRASRSLAAGCKD